MDGNQSFFEDGGKRWFKTGDIGEYDDKGMGLLKLANEYSGLTFLSNIKLKIISGILNYRKSENY